MRTIKEWRKRGYKIRKGAKNRGKNKYGQYIFDSLDVEPFKIVGCIVDYDHYDYEVGIEILS